MQKILTFKDLKVWQSAHKLILSVYKITIKFPKDEQYGLISQMRRCGVSIPSNISEGFKRRGRDKFQFYSYSEASLEELKYQILLSYELNYISEDEYNGLMNLAEETGKLLNGWIKSVK
ncbi:four helix bundle protein [Candidatus Falkowbacteria bacterium]|nr:four helix bundle protein [Candidatus Falkowbacteria bacterium]